MACHCFGIKLSECSAQGGGYFIFSGGEWASGGEGGGRTLLMNMCNLCVAEQAETCMQMIAEDCSPNEGRQTNEIQ